MNVSDCIILGAALIGLIVIIVTTERRDDDQDNKFGV